MTKPAFIVEGVCEKKFIQSICHGSKISMLGINGKSVSSLALAKRIGSQFKLFNNKYFPIVVMFDRERREKTCAEIRAEVSAYLVADGIPLDQLRFIIADRKIESWMLYAVKENGNIDRTCDHSQLDEFDGKSSEAELGRRLSIAGKKYHKTTVGVDILRKLCPENLSKVSSSFASALKEIDFECKWVTAA